MCAASLGTTPQAAAKAAAGSHLNASRSCKIRMLQLTSKMSFAAKLRPDSRPPPPLPPLPVTTSAGSTYAPRSPPAREADLADTDLLVAEVKGGMGRTRRRAAPVQAAGIETQLVAAGGSRQEARGDCDAPPHLLPRHAHSIATSARVHGATAQTSQTVSSFVLPKPDQHQHVARCERIRYESQQYVTKLEFTC